MTEDLDIYEAPVTPANLFGARDPAEVVARSTEAANALVDVIREKKLYATIGQKSHVLVDGWTLLGSMMGVFPVVVWTRKLEQPDGWEARVEAKTLSGAVVGAAEAMCMRSEAQWGKRDDYALRSMAQTRATSKALRGPLGFIVHLAGFSATPAEEMPPGSSSAAPKPKKITDAQKKKIHAMTGELDRGNPPEGFGNWEEARKAWMLGRFQTDTTTALTSEQASETIAMLQTQIDRTPF